MEQPGLAENRPLLVIGELLVGQLEKTAWYKVSSRRRRASWLGLCKASELGKKSAVWLVTFR